MFKVVTPTSTTEFKSQIHAEEFYNIIRDGIVNDDLKTEVQLFDEAIELKSCHHTDKFDKHNFQDEINSALSGKGFSGEEARNMFRVMIKEAQKNRDYTVAFFMLGGDVPLFIHTDKKHFNSLKEGNEVNMNVNYFKKDDPLRSVLESNFNELVEKNALSKIRGLLADSLNLKPTEEKFTIDKIFEGPRDSTQVKGIFVSQKGNHVNAREHHPLKLIYEMSRQEKVYASIQHSFVEEYKALIRKNF